MSTSQLGGGLRTSPPLNDLRRLVEQPGPFASVLIELLPAAEDSAEHRRLRWQPLADSLEEAGTPSEVVDGLTNLVLDRPSHGRALSAVVGPSEPTVVEQHLEAPRAEYARWAEVPSLAPIIEWRQLTPPHVVVLADRTGADIHVADPGGQAYDTSAEGEHDEIHKPQAGGWSQRRFQARAADSWERNAETVADRVAGLADSVAAAVVILAGDPQAVSLVRDELDSGTEHRVETLDHGSRDAGPESIATDVIHLVATASADDTVTLLERWKQETGRGERAVEGADATVDALATARVDTLLVHDDEDDDRTALVGPSAEQIGLDAAALEDLGVEDPARVRMVDACIRAGLGTGADVRIVPRHGGPEAGLGAILRWA